FLWREQWSFEGIPFEIGRPENVATDPAYRNRGLVRAIFELVHARSAAERHPLQAITGIPHFYRQFGYEYAFDLHGRRVAYTALLPPALPDTPEPYALRPATVADVPRITELYQRRRAESVVWNEVGEQYWRYLVEVWGDPSAPHDPLAMGVGECLQIIVDATGEACGYAMVAAKLWGSDLQVSVGGAAPEDQPGTGRPATPARAARLWRPAAEPCDQPRAVARAELLPGPHAPAQRRACAVARADNRAALCVVCQSS